MSVGGLDRAVGIPGKNGAHDGLVLCFYFQAAGIALPPNLHERAT
jgi:hypothetical protein